MMGVVKNIADLLGFLWRVPPLQKQTVILDLNSRNVEPGCKIEVLHPPAGHYLSEAVVELLRPEGGTLSMSLGYWFDEGCVIKGFNCNSTSGTLGMGEEGTALFPLVAIFHGWGDFARIAIHASFQPVLG